MFALNKTYIADVEVLSIQGLDNKCGFSIIPSFGASLLKAHLSKQNKTHNILKSWDNPSSIKEDYSLLYFGAQLFPFPNRLSRGQYTWNNIIYNFQTNDFGRPNALHGHVFNKEFLIESFDENTGLLIMKYESPSDDSFPFKYKLIVNYQLSENSLSISTKIENIATTSMPFGHGWHPYFPLPTELDTFQLLHPQMDQFVLDELAIPTGPVNTFQNNALSDLRGAQLDDCFKFIDQHQKISLVYKAYTLRIEFEDYEFVQIYLPADKKSIAIEPQTCAPNAFNNKIGLQSLEPAQSRSFGFSISI